MCPDLDQHLEEQWLGTWQVVQFQPEQQGGHSYFFYHGLRVLGGVTRKRWHRPPVPVHSAKIFPFETLTNTVIDIKGAVRSSMQLLAKIMPHRCGQIYLPT